MGGSIGGLSSLPLFLATVSLLTHRRSGQVTKIDLPRITASDSRWRLTPIPPYRPLSTIGWGARQVYDQVLMTEPCQADRIFLRALAAVCQ